jgi:2-dehydro-3-deoxyphosphogluconate aldolase/(4S)-4-hydroxy-2-oxoglutarate aldolase
MTMKKVELLQKIKQAGVVAVLRAKSCEEVITLSEQAVLGGIHALEITMTTPGAVQAIEQLSRQYADHPDVIVGAGTVLDAATAVQCIHAGAGFVVSPSLSIETMKAGNRYQIPVLPGIMTMRDLQEAYEYGADIVKLFPGNLFQPDIIKAIKGPYPHANVMPTGGVGLHNMEEWVKAGALAIGIGSDLTKEAEQKKDLTLVQAKAKQYIEKWKQVK